MYNNNLYKSYKYYFKDNNKNENISIRHRKL